MKRKSKVLMIGASVAAVSMFAVTAFASTPDLEGYKAFKEVLKANQIAEQTIESGTVNGNFSIQLDGKTLVEADGTAKVKDAGGKYSASTDFDLSLPGIKRSGSMYSSNGDTAYFVDQTHGLHYQIINLDHEHDGKHGNRPEPKNAENRPINKSEEALLDFMVGDLSDDFSVASHTDGSKTITLDVSKEEVPTTVRLLMDVASAGGAGKPEHASEMPAELEGLMQLPFFQGFDTLDLEGQLPELTKDVAIEHVRLQMTVDTDNKLQGVQGEFEVSGKDEAGIAHRVTLEGAGDISGVNATTPDVYNPAGHSAEIIDADVFEDRG